MAAALDRARNILAGGGELVGREWLDTDGRVTRSVEARAMLRLTWRLQRGFTSARIDVDDVPAIADLLPAVILA